ncbi:MAG: hypothetical protein AB7O96_08090 [Pseudobdellovibrionaceae bacterium]
MPKPVDPKEINKEDLPPMASPIDPKQEEFKEKARKRLYPGGIDEEDLRVQVDLPRPEKSISGPVTPGTKPELEHEGF